MSADLTAGVPVGSLPDGGTVAGRVGDDEVVLVRSGDRFFAVGAHCTHYRGALADGLVVGNTIRCPLHHACFDLTSGEPLRAPALDPIGCWRVEREGDAVFVRDKMPPQPAAASIASRRYPPSIVIIGGGAAGLAELKRAHRADDPPISMPNGASSSCSIHA